MGKSYQIRLKTCMLFAQKNEKLGKGLCEISRISAKSHTTKRDAFRSADGQREPNQPDLVSEPRYCLQSVELEVCCITLSLAFVFLRGEKTCC